jgi:hypothetical protein
MNDARPRATIRSHLRWVNGIGFALTLFFALWLIAFVLVTLKGGLKLDELPLPRPYVFVGAVSLVGMIVLLGVFFARFMWHGHDLSMGNARAFLFAWTCAGAVFFLSQGLAMLRFGPGGFPRLPDWLSDLYWYLGLVGMAVFSLLLWVNAEPGAHHLLTDDEDWEEDEGYEDAYDDDEGYEDDARR